MSQISKVVLKDVDGNVLHPQTDAGIVSVNDAAGSPSNVQSEIQALREKQSEMANIDFFVNKGDVNSDADLPAQDYKNGWAYYVATAGVYKGQTCEVGDTIVCKADFSGTANDEDWYVIQANARRPVEGVAASTARNLIIFADASGKQAEDSGISIEAVTKKASIVIEHGAAIPRDDLRDDAIVFEKLA
ncbi:hypothetical protein [Desulfovibrio sp. ZJ200]|uniref:hypothetical protein n=2 Tax=unclassified Desulfovibrio TaxID=2593640 RepID=UPI0013EC86C9|nr:hypothetical protein [Desulfovibrio sp. ZJ200]